jgi:DNA-directed RNA polymerase specialized sigma24 family protein
MNKAELATRIEEAYWTWRILPDKDRRFLRAKMASWPVFVQQIMEAYGWHEVRRPDEPPNPDAIDRAEEVLGWFARHLMHHQDGAKSLWLTYGRGLSLSQTGHVMHCSKETVASRRRTATAVLLHRLSLKRPAWLDRLERHG